MNHQVVSLRGKFLSEFPASSHTSPQLTLVVSKLKYFLLKPCFKQESNELSTVVPIPAPPYPEPIAFRVRALFLMIPSCVSESSSTQHFIFQVQIAEFDLQGAQMLSHFSHYLMQRVLKLEGALESPESLLNRWLGPIPRLSDSVSLR